MENDLNLGNLPPLPQQNAAEPVTTPNTPAL